MERYEVNWSVVVVEGEAEGCLQIKNHPQLLAYASKQTGVSFAKPGNQKWKGVRSGGRMNPNGDLGNLFSWRYPVEIVGRRQCGP